jgi:hypothetical protein
MPKGKLRDIAPTRVWVWGCIYAAKSSQLMAAKLALTVVRERVQPSGLRYLLTLMEATDVRPYLKLTPGH